MLKVKPIEIEWHNGLSIYASEAFLKAVGDEYGWLGGFDDMETLRCILPYTIVCKAFIRMVRFRVETIPIGKDLETQEEKSFLNKVVEYFRFAGAAMIIPATTNTIFQTYPEGAIAAPYGTYISDLTQSEETIWGKFSASHRRKVRLAIKEKVEIRAGLEYLDAAYNMVRDTFKRSSLPFMAYNAFRQTVHSLGQSVKVFVAEHQGVIQGCTVVPFSKHTAYYLYGGSIAHPIVGANHLLHWEAMKHFREQGVERYDFVGVRIHPEKGSKQDGLMSFKQRFGGKLIKGYMWKYPLNQLKYLAYSIAIRILKGGDIVDQERQKLRVD